MDARQEQQLLCHLHLRIQTALLGQVAEGMADVRVHRLARPAHRAAIGPEDVEHHADGRRLARAVGAEKAEDGAWLRGERTLRHGLHLTERLRNIEDFEHVVRLVFWYGLLDLLSML